MKPGNPIGTSLRNMADPPEFGQVRGTPMHRDLPTQHGRSPGVRTGWRQSRDMSLVHVYVGAQ